jgi:hypothetical protein
MSGLAWATLGLLSGFLLAALGDLVSEEIRGWLDLAPRAVLRLAAAQLRPEMREITYRENWLPDLIYVLRGAESRPITRLIRGMSFALGLLISAHKIASHQSASSLAPGPIGPRLVRIGPFQLGVYRKDQMMEMIYVSRPDGWKQISRAECQKLVEDRAIKIRKLPWADTEWWSWPPSPIKRT